MTAVFDNDGGPQQKSNKNNNNDPTNKNDCFYLFTSFYKKNLNYLL